MLTTLFALEAAAVLFGVIGLAWWLRRRFNTRWGTWVWGAVSFGGSQIVRIPLLLVFTAFLQQIGFKPERETAFWINVAVLGLTSGLFEETARYIVLRWLDKNSRSWRAALMFGAGHGGIEALIFIIPAMVTNLVLLSSGDALLAQLRAGAPDQAAQLATALENIRSVTWWQPLLAVWERVTAITFHISASILIMLAVMKARPRPVVWWGSAVLFHTAFNVAALIAGRYGGLVGAEIAATVFCVIALYLIFRLRQRAELAPAAIV